MSSNLEMRQKHTGGCVLFTYQYYSLPHKRLEHPQILVLAGDWGTYLWKSDVCFIFKCHYLEYFWKLCPLQHFTFNMYNFNSVKVCQSYTFHDYFRRYWDARIQRLLIESMWRAFLLLTCTSHSCASSLSTGGHFPVDRKPEIWASASTAFPYLKSVAAAYSLFLFHQHCRCPISWPVICAEYC